MGPDLSDIRGRFGRALAGFAVALLSWAFVAAPVAAQDAAPLQAPAVDPSAASAAAQDPPAAAALPDPSEETVVRKRPLLAAAEVVAVNGVVWIYDRYIRSGGGEGFKIGLQSWKENYLNGFEWDDNTFSTNQYAHPYHGSLYFNSARSNGFNYWESIPFTFAGSFMWEYFGETHHAAFNDWINTSVGGTTLGESFFRLATMVTDNTATGSGRTWRELGGTLISPVRGFTRLVTGDFTRVHANSSDRFPKAHSVSYRVGFRTVGQDHLWDADTTRVFMEIAAASGDPFLGEYRKPFDSFDFSLQLNFADKATFGRMNARGILFASPIARTETSQHLIGAYQHFDYYSNNAFEFGGQSVGASLLSQMSATKAFEVRTQLHMNAILIGATKSDYPSISGRQYDFGPGLGYKFSSTFYLNRHPFLILAHDQYWIHSLNGTAAEHFISGTRARVDIELARGFSIGADYVLYLADRDYRDFPDVHQRVPELRTAVAWNL